jgi:hypothetical protein
MYIEHIYEYYTALGIFIGRVDKVNGQVVTIGSKSVKVWNANLQVVDA